MPYALCPMPYALCPIVPRLSEKGYTWDLMNHPDSVVLDAARENERVLLTRNCDDFQQLHQANPEHSGILAVYQDSEASKNMSYQAIGSAIDNLEIAEYELNNQFVVLNHWSY